MLFLVVTFRLSGSVSHIQLGTLGVLLTVRAPTAQTAASVCKHGRENNNVQTRALNGTGDSNRIVRE